LNEALDALAHVGDDIVDQVNGALHDWQQQEEETNQDPAEDREIGQQRKKGRGDEEDGDELDAGDVEIVRIASDECANAIGDGGMEVDARGELRESLVDKIVTHMTDAALHTRISEGEARAFAGEVESDLRYLDLGAVGVASNVSHLRPVAFAGFKLGGGVGSGGILVEAIQSDAGVIVPPNDFMPALRALCDKYDLYLIDDEVKAGMGRTGKLWACQLTGTDPDVMIVGKGVASGQSMSATVAPAEVLDILAAGHAFTTAGAPVACAAAIATLDVLRDEKLAEKGFKGDGAALRKDIEAVISVDPEYLNGSFAAMDETSA